MENKIYVLVFKLNEINKSTYIDMFVYTQNNITDNAKAYL